MSGPSDALGVAMNDAILALSSGEQAIALACWKAIALPILDATAPTAPTAWLVSAKSSAFAAAVWTRYAVTTSGGSVTASLPVASSGNQGMGIAFKKLSAANNLIIGSASLIDGAATQTFAAQWQSVTVYSTGATWYIA